MILMSKNPLSFSSKCDWESITRVQDLSFHPWTSNFQFFTWFRSDDGLSLLKHIQRWAADSNMQPLRRHTYPPLIRRTGILCVLYNRILCAVWRATFVTFLRGLNLAYYGLLIQLVLWAICII